MSDLQPSDYTSMKVDKISPNATSKVILDAPRPFIEWILEPEEGMATTATTQAGATALTKPLSIFETVHALNGSAILPACEEGLVMVVHNNTATQMQVYPAVGEYVGANLVNVANAIAAGYARAYFGTSTGRWGIS